MEIMTGVNINDTVNFSLFTGAQAVVPTAFENCKIIAVMDADSVKVLIDPITMHTQIYPALRDAGQLLVNDPAGYLYYKVRLSNGEVTAIGSAWVNETTVEVITSTTAMVRVEGVTNLTRLKEVLSSNGFQVHDVELV